MIWSAISVHDTSRIKPSDKIRAPFAKQWPVSCRSIPILGSEAAEWRWAHTLLQHCVVSETSSLSVLSGQGERRPCHRGLPLSYSNWQKRGKVLEKEAVAYLNVREALCSSLSLFMMKLHSLITSLSVDQWLSPVTTKIALVQLPCKGHALLISWVLAIRFAVPY